MSFERVFVYGTLKAGFPNHLLNHGRRLSGDFLTGDAYPLYLAGERCSPWLIDQPGDGMRVVGELYELDEEALARMDALERIELTSGYKRQLVEVINRLDGRRQSVFVYLKTAAQLAEAEVELGPLPCYEARHAERYRHRHC